MMKYEFFIHVLRKEDAEHSYSKYIELTKALVKAENDIDHKNIELELKFKLITPTLHLFENIYFVLRKELRSAQQNLESYRKGLDIRWESILNYGKVYNGLLNTYLEIKNKLEIEELTKKKFAMHYPSLILNLVSNCIKVEFISSDFAYKYEENSDGQDIINYLLLRAIESLTTWFGFGIKNTEKIEKIINKYFYALLDEDKSSQNLEQQLHEFLENNSFLVLE